jgi:hypothetical protein
MNAKSINEGGKLELGLIAAIIFPISIIITLFALVLAFNEPWRNSVSGVIESVIDCGVGVCGINRSRRGRRRWRRRGWNGGDEEFGAATPCRS